MSRYAEYLFMNGVVLPLSAVPGAPFPPRLVLWPVVLPMVGVGLPIALAVRRFAR